MRKESASGVRTLLAGVRGMAWLKGKGGIPLEAQALYRRAREMADRGKYEEAVALLKQGVMIAPCFMRALDELGECLGRLGRYPEALASFEQSLGIGETAGGYQGLGNCQAALDNNEAALEAYQNWLRLAPTSIWSHKAVGQTFFKLKRYKEAAEIYSRAIQLGDQPGIVDCYAGLGDAYLALQDYGAALDAYLNWVSRSPDSVSANSKVAAAYIGLGDCWTAKSYLDKALAIDPQNQYAQNLLKQCQP